MAASIAALNPPLCVSLESALVRTDLLLESLVHLLKHRPLCFLLLPLWLLRGRAALEAEVFARVSLSAETLPYNRQLLNWLQGERTAGRNLWLCTASSEVLAKRVASHLGLFDGVITSDRSADLVGAKKATRLVEQFGERGFDYCGNERHDIASWKRARGAILAQGNRRLEHDIVRHVPVLRTLSPRTNTVKAIVRALRPHQWIKNGLLFVPLVAAHRLDDLSALGDAILAFSAFCLCASAVYVVNDLLDLDADRAHPRKCQRPFASGDLSIGAGLVLAPLLLGSAVVFANFLSVTFQIALAAYFCLTLAYSFALKGVVLVDALTLAGLYTLRIVAGGSAVDVRVSMWLLLFSIFLFLSLAFVKRYAELDSLRRLQRVQAVGRDYAVDDLPVLQSLGTAAGYMSIVVLALYINSSDVESLYRRPSAMWLLCVLLLYWISRVWMTAQRGRMHDDPIVFALKDRVSLAIGLLAAVTTILAV